MSCDIPDFGWWITAIEIPAITALFGLIWILRRDMETALSAMRDTISGFQLNVARTYAETTAVKELENRLTSHLLRIEAKLDTTAMKTEIIYNQEVSS